MKGPAIGTGILGILCGIGILIIGKHSPSSQMKKEVQKDSRGKFADKLRDHQSQSEDSPESSSGNGK
jgi:hypothetical protein